MKSPVVLIGIGEMGGVFARGFLRAGYPVYPATRVTDQFRGWYGTRRPGQLKNCSTPNFISSHL